MRPRLALVAIGLAVALGGLRPGAQDVVLVTGTISGSVSVPGVTIDLAIVEARSVSDNTVARTYIYPDASSANYSLLVSVPASGGAKTFTTKVTVYSDSYRDSMEFGGPQVSVSATSSATANFSTTTVTLEVSLDAECWRDYPDYYWQDTPVHSAWIYVKGTTVAHTAGTYPWKFPVPVTSASYDAFQLTGTVVLFDGRTVPLASKYVGLSRGLDSHVYVDTQVGCRDGGGAIGGTVGFFGPVQPDSYEIHAATKVQSISPATTPAPYLISGVPSGTYTVVARATLNGGDDTFDLPRPNVAVGGSPVIQDIFAEQAFVNGKVTVTGAPTILPHVTSGLIRALGPSSASSLDALDAGQNFDLILSTGAWNVDLIYVDYDYGTPRISGYLGRHFPHPVTVAEGQTVVEDFALEVGEALITIRMADGSVFQNPGVNASCDINVPGKPHYFASTLVSVVGVSSAQIPLAAAGYCTLIPFVTTMDGAWIDLPPFSLDIVPGTTTVIDYGALPHLTVKSITFETRYWAGRVPLSGIDAVDTYFASPVGRSGYASAPQGLTVVDGASNQATFAGVNNHIAYHHRIPFDAPVAGPLSIRFGGDFGSGGALLVDGEPIAYQRDAIWWRGNWDNGDQRLLGSTHVTPGPHVLDIYGFEDCCDGTQAAEFSYLGQPFKTLRAPTNMVPRVTTVRKVAGLGGDTEPYVGSTPLTFAVSVADGDSGSSYTVTNLNCGAHATGAVTAGGAQFECTFHEVGPSVTSTVSLQVEDNRGALSPVSTWVMRVGAHVQTIDFTAPSSVSIADGDFAVSATSSWGLPVSIAASGPCTIAGQTVHPTAAGTCTLTASALGYDQLYLPATPVVRQVAIAAADQTITFAPVAPKTYGDPPFTISAAASSGLPVAIAVASGPATISGNILTLTGGGTVTLVASQAGSAVFNPASATQSFAVARPDLGVTSITLETRQWNQHVPTSSQDAIATYFSLPVGRTGYAPGPKTLTLFDNVSNHVTFGGTTQNIGYHHHFAFYAPVEGSLALRMGADFGGGGTLVIDGVPVQFHGWDMWWNASYADPNQHLYAALQIPAGAHTIDSYGFEPCCDGPQQAQYSYLGAPFKTFTAPVNTVPVVALSGPTSVAIGSTPNYSFTVADPDAGATFTAAVSCGASGSLLGPATVTPTGGSFDCAFPTGNTTAIVSAQATDNFGAMSNVAAVSVAVNKLPQIIAFPAPPATTWGANDFVISASASSALPVTIVASGACTVAGGVGHIVAAGTCMLTATQAGDATYAAAPDVVRSVEIAKALLTVTAGDKARAYGVANPPLTAAYSGFVHGETLATSGVSGNPALATAAVTASPAGTYAITAAAGSLAASNYAFEFVNGTLTITKAAQTIAFDPLADVTYGTGDIALSASATSGLPVNFSAAGQCSLAGTRLHIEGAGACTVTASQPGDGNFTAAADVSRTLAIAKAAATISVMGYSGVYDGAPHGATGSATGVNGESLATLLSLGSTFTNVPGGTAQWTFAGNGNYSPASGEVPIAITKADAAITVTGYTGIYDGAAHGAKGSAAGVNGENLTSLLSLGNAFTNVPGGTALWAFGGNGNYSAANGEVAIAITKADATVTVTGYTGIYDGAAHGATGSATGVNGESLTTLLSLGEQFTNVPGGTAQWTFAGNGNYSAANGEVPIAIAKADAAITVSGYTGIYDGAPHGATGSATGVNGESLTMLLSLGDSFTNVPGGTAQWSFAGNGNYSAANGEVPIAITKADATVTVTGYTGIYDGAPHGATGSATGVNGESLTSLLSLGSTFTNVPGGTAQWTFAGDGNYRPANGEVPIAITKADAAITVTGYTGIYDGAAHGATGSATGVNGESLTALLSLGSTFTNVPGGTAPWTFAGDGNYRPANGEVPIAITKADAAITVIGYTGIYDGAAHGATGSATGVNGESLTSLLSLGNAFTNVPGGTAQWTFAGNGNYNTAHGSAPIVLGQAALTVTAEDKTKLFGAALPTFTVAYAGFVGLDGPPALGGTLGFATAATASSPVGTYAVTPGGLTSGNYTLTFAPGALQITYNVCAQYDQTRVHNSGSTIPVKLQVCDAAGANASSAATVVQATGLVRVSNQAAGDVEDSGQANPDDNFRFTGSLYLFNLQTKGLSTGTYRLLFTATGDPQVHGVFVKIK